MSRQSQCDAIHWRPLLGSAVALVFALAGLQGQIAHASCGDHLERTTHHTNVSLFDLARHHSPPVTPPLPCHGPGCRRAPVVPDTPSSVDVQSSEFERLLVAASPLSFGLSEIDLQYREEILPQAGHRVGLDRPPQSV